MKVSLPAPPVIVSLTPAPPAVSVNVSLPAPPLIVSEATPPVMASALFPPSYLMVTVLPEATVTSDASIVAPRSSARTLNISAAAFPGSSVFAFAGRRGRAGLLVFF